MSILSPIYTNWESRIICSSDFYIILKKWDYWWEQEAYIGFCIFFFFLFAVDFLLAMLPSCHCTCILQIRWHLCQRIVILLGNYLRKGDEEKWTDQTKIEEIEKRNKRWNEGRNKKWDIENKSKVEKIKENNYNNEETRQNKGKSVEIIRRNFT